MEGLKDYVTGRGQRRAARLRRAPMVEDVGEVRTIRPQGLQAATVVFPAGIDLDERAARMNHFWQTLVDLQHEDVVVVALCSTHER